MKKTDLAKVYAALIQNSPRITVTDSVAIKARAAIDRMLAL
jgi:quinolinate synthase